MPSETGAERIVDLTGERALWRRAHEKAAVAVPGPLSGLLLLRYQRRPAEDAGIEILGDTGRFDAWWERVSFWQRE